MSEEASIHPLDEATVQRIAAGEVVERPASVVKELLENSLDAGASRVSVAVDRGGIDGVRVRDDGVGMTERELELAVQEHTTSKIADIGDLESGVATLGFRGEALHTIGAVSRLTVRSRPREGVDTANGTDAGAELTVEGGDVGRVRPAGCPPGTVVEVEDLFFNTPARKKFLKTEATEFDHVNRVVTQYALANPDVAVSLDHDGREVFATEGTGDLESAILSVYGRDVAESMVRVDAAPDESVDAVSGLVSHPETTRSTRDYLSTFVNGRYVTSRVLREAVLDAYGGQLAPDRYPFAVLFVDVPADAVDVNVHPRKMEVRFDDEANAKSAVRGAVRDALLDHGLVRSTAPRGRSAPDETEISPERPTREATTAESSPPAANDDADSSAPSADDPAEPTSVERSTEPSADGQASEADSSASRPSPSRSASPPASADSRRSSFDGDADGSHLSPVGSSEFTGPTQQRTLTGEDAAPEREFDTLPRMRVLGQLYDTYLVAETPGGLVLVDQHAADERVNYERLRETMAGDTPTQALAEPVELELTAREAELFEEYREALARVGFHATRTDDRTVEVRTVPAVTDAAIDPELLRDALSGFVDGEGEATVDAVVDSLLSDLACYPSITGNTSLREGSVVDLLSALDDCQNPYACPHGRPVVVRFDRDELEERFERDYPGHAGRRSE
ncbi:DNA mismatch repair endonuclease MutL [Salinirarus marinus]|uniref:DNA mismatch repair endonuclease MutL n=1 Tax=Salinirarus marinus TaxID=3068310 RepID=UPI003C6CBF4E